MPEIDPRVATYSIRAAWVFFRPLVSYSLNQHAADFRIVSENAPVNDRRAVWLRRTDPQTKTIEDFWVDPAHADSVIRWECQPPRQGACTISLVSQEDSNSGWIPERWTVDFGLVAECTMTGFATNEEYPRDAFLVTFPAGTVVLDRRSKEQYAIRRDGSRTHVTKFGSPESLKIYEALQMPVEFAIDPQPLTDALGFIATRSQIQVTVDNKAFHDAGVDPKTEVSVMNMPGISLRRLLQVLLGQLGRPVGFELRDGALVIAPITARPTRDKSPVK
jgi:hypothetical protein